MRGAGAHVALLLAIIAAKSAAFEHHVFLWPSMDGPRQQFPVALARTSCPSACRSRPAQLSSKCHPEHPSCLEAEDGIPSSRMEPSVASDLMPVGPMVLAVVLASVLSVHPVEAASAVVAGGAAASTNTILEQAAKRALGGGISGALAGVAQVLLLMWLRTTMNYQYRNGGSTTEALDALYKEGGIPRLYRGVSFALFQTPLSRFGDTAANSGMLALLATSDLPMSVRTACASAVAATWRMGLTPIDTMKTTLQVRGADGYKQVTDKVKAEGVTVLYQGALANAFASFIGNYPWYLTFNTLNEMLPPFGEELSLKLIRSALLGISAAGVSDCISNSVRVLKTTRQTSEVTISYQEAAERILERDGWRGLFGRGLGTRLVTNSLQAALFTVLWKLLEEKIAGAGLF
jgi:hypothetical protein